MFRTESNVVLHALTAPKPIYENPGSDDWGFITCRTNEFDWHSKYWFRSLYDAIGFLCLGAGDYLSWRSIDERNAQSATVAQRLPSTIGAFQSGDLKQISSALLAIADLWGGDPTLAFFGQFKELESGSDPFAVELRRAYFDGLQYQEHPKAIPASDDHFAEWVDGFDGFHSASKGSEV